MKQNQLTSEKQVFSIKSEQGLEVWLKVVVCLPGKSKTLSLNASTT
jgi:hypothetical protein